MLLSVSRGVVFTATAAIFKILRMTQSETTKRCGNSELSAFMIKLKHKGILPQLPDKKDNGFPTLSILENPDAPLPPC
jgi:hypothetical protein